MELTGKARRFPSSFLVLKVWWPATHPGTLGVMDNDMMHKVLLNITAIVLLIIVLTGCSSTNPNVSSLNESDCSLQVKNSVTLPFGT
jgi:hypothetical protein